MLGLVTHGPTCLPERFSLTSPRWADPSLTPPKARLHVLTRRSPGRVYGPVGMVCLQTGGGGVFTDWLGWCVYGPVGWGGVFTPPPGWG